MNTFHKHRGYQMFKMIISQKKSFFVIFLIGVLIFILTIVTRPSLPVKPAEEKGRLVQTLTLQQSEIVPQVVGFGKVAPKFVWQSIAEVSGKVVFKHADLEKGRILEQGTEVLRIDPLESQLALARSRADLSASQTRLRQHDQEKINLEGTLAIEERRLYLVQKEFNRLQNILSKHLTSQSQVDKQHQAVLQQQKLVQDMRDSLALSQDERKVIEAEVNVRQAQVQSMEHALEKTHIILPEKMRIAEVNAELNQVVNVQQHMLTAHGLETMEVEAQMSVHDLQILRQSLPQVATDEPVAPEQILAQLTAQIVFESGAIRATWPAKVVRIDENIDPIRATVGLILEIEQPSGDRSGISHLVSGMFVQAVILGGRRSHWHVPEAALHGKTIYLKNKQNRLHIQPVEVLFRRDNQVIVQADLQAGDQLIVNDLLPAIEGMKLKTAQPKVLAKGEGK